MSRTDKDLPYWVRAEWFEPVHLCGWYRTWAYHPGDRTHGKVSWRFRGECDLPPGPVPKTDRNHSLRTRTKCYWAPEFLDTQAKYCMHKRESRRLFFHKPMRNKERLAAREIKYGNIDYEYPDGRGRHSVLWSLW